MTGAFRNKKILIISAFIAIIIISAAFIPVTEKDYITVRAPLNNILPAVQQVKNWKKWHPDFVRDSSVTILTDKQLIAGKDTINVVTTTPFGILVNQKEGTAASVYSLVVRPSDDPNLSRIEIRFATRLLTLIWDEIVNLLPTGPNRILLALTNYLENTKAFYGYPITYATVTDTLVITITGTANASMITDSLRSFLSRLRTFASLNKLEVLDSPMVYIQRTELPMKKIMAGIPVNKEVPAISPIEYQRMPEGRMLTVDFKGDYHRIQDAYRAGDRFINDYNLKSVALPYERYYSVKDSSNAHIRIFIPIF